MKMWWTAWLSAFFLASVWAQDRLACSLVEGGDLAALDWLVGHWRLENGDRVSEEWWVPAAGGLMLGLHRDTKPQKRAFFEYLRIERRDGQVVYVASPMGGGTTDFKLTECGTDWVRFENPDHDWPTVISYRLEGETLVALAGGGEGDKVRTATWRLTRVAVSP